jgi:hypothetical protein
MRAWSQLVPASLALFRGEGVGKNFGADVTVE